MDPFVIVQKLERVEDSNRRLLIEDILESYGIPRVRQKYSTGTNLIVPSDMQKVIGVSCHFDTVPNSPGANDNASSCAVAVDLAIRLKEQPTENFGVEFYLFDDEELGLRGSKAYAEEFPLPCGLFNMEMVGAGDMVAVWPVNGEHKGPLLSALEVTALNRGIPVYKLAELISHSADHLPFMVRGIEAFTISAVTRGDMAVAAEYMAALERGASPEEAEEIKKLAPIFMHYHRSTDVSTHLSSDSLRMVSDLLYDTIRLIDNHSGRK